MTRLRAGDDDELIIAYGKCAADLALAFLLLIGVVLVADGMGQHVSKAYIYIAMAFSLFVELLNLRYRTRRQPVRLRQRYERR